MGDIEAGVINYAWEDARVKVTDFDPKRIISEVRVHADATFVHPTETCFARFGNQ